MGLQRVRNPVEYSFHIWMSAFPDSTHPADKSRFYTFVKTVCRYNAKNWKKSEYVRQRIIKRNPKFDLGRLEYHLRLLNELIEFYEAEAIMSGLQFTKVEVKKDHIRELIVKNDELLITEILYHNKINTADR
jgi:hypothetical protein